MLLLGTIIVHMMHVNQKLQVWLISNNCISALKFTIIYNMLQSNEQ